MKVCQVCNNKLGKRDRFCGKCGSSMFNEVPARAKYCLYCGATLESKAKFCSKCGKECGGDISLSFIGEKKEVPEGVELEFLKGSEEIDSQAALEIVSIGENGEIIRENAGEGDADAMNGAHKNSNASEVAGAEDEAQAKFEAELAEAIKEATEEETTKINEIKAREKEIKNNIAEVSRDIEDSESEAAQSKKKAELANVEAARLKDELKSTIEKINAEIARLEAELKSSVDRLNGEINKVSEDETAANEAALKAEKAVEKKKQELGKLEEKLADAEGERKAVEAVAAEKAAKERERLEEERRKAEEERRRLEEEARRKAEEEARRKAEEEAKRKAEEEAKRKAEEEARRKAEEEARRKAEEEARRKAEEEARLKAEEEARLKAEEEARLKAEEEARLKAEEEARLKAEEEARLKAEEEARRKAEEERLRAEEEARRKAEEEEARRKAEEEERLRREEEERLRREEEERQRKEEERRRKEEEARILEEARRAEEERKRLEEEARIKELEELYKDATSSAKKALDKHKKNPAAARSMLEAVLDKFKNLYNKMDSNIDVSETRSDYNEVVEILGVTYYTEGAFKLAIPLLREASENGSCKARIYLTQWLLRNRGELPDDPGFLLEYVTDAIEGDVTEVEVMIAYRVLAKMYRDGIGVKKSLPTAFDYFMKAADMGDISSVATIGQCYMYGEGVKKNNKEAFKWNTKAAEGGDPGGIRNLAICYDLGTGTVRDAKKAVEWYKKLLEIMENDRFAMYRIAVCLSDPDKEYNIKPTDEMYKEAYEFATKALEIGEKNACYVLGYLHMMGRAVPKDFNEAMNYFTKAAYYGNHRAKDKTLLFVKNPNGTYSLK